MAKTNGEHGFKSIIVVGAGPAGLLLALLLAREGISVQLFDAAAQLDSQPRATHYGAPAVVELDRAGVLKDVRAAGFVPRGVCWRKLDGTYLAGLDATVLDGNADRMVCLPLNKLGQILYKHLLAQPTASVNWHHKAIKIGQDDSIAWVEVDTSDGIKRFEADYIVGCDGANSQIRRSLFGDSEFPGYTWDQQIVATNTYYPFDKYGYEDSNFIIHPEHWHMAARISKDGMWRVTYGEKPGLSQDELLARQLEKFKIILPGHPDEDGYRLANFSPYKVHQRLAEKLRAGRFLLAADAAHLCNPFGGLGLTGGIVDVGNLFDCLLGIYQGKADPTILDKYDEVRRQKYSEIVNPVSTANLKLLFEQDPDSALENEFLQTCKRTETDLEFSKEFQTGVNGIKYDFTQHYYGGTAGNGVVA